MNTAVLGLGSNIAPDQNIPQAITLLANKFKLIAKSDFVTTRPIGDLTQADFLNGAVLIQTTLLQSQLQGELKKIEEVLGREQSNDKFAARTIDLDIIVWNNQIIDQDFYSRDFVKAATLQLLPTLKY